MPRGIHHAQFHEDYVFNRQTARPQFIVMGLLCMLGGSLLADAQYSTRPANGALPEYSSTRESAFLEANEKAMIKMMRKMHIRPTGDVDRDFVAEMIPHHQAAIDMASALLKSGGNETLKRLAQEIIVTQEDEIAAMRLAIGKSQSGLQRHP